MRCSRFERSRIVRKLSSEKQAAVAPGTAPEHGGKRESKVRAGRPQKPSGRLGDRHREER